MVVEGIGGCGGGWAVWRGEAEDARVRGVRGGAVEAGDGNDRDAVDVGQHWERRGADDAVFGSSVEEEGVARPQGGGRARRVEEFEGRLGMVGGWGERDPGVAAGVDGDGEGVAAAWGA